MFCFVLFFHKKTYLCKKILAMKHYFLLQKKLIDRHLLDLGLKPFLGYLLVFLVFLSGSFYLFSKANYSQAATPYIYSLFAAIFVLKMSEKNRCEFLKLCFPSATYFKVRAIENISIVLPFFLFLIFKVCFFAAFILLIISILSIFYTAKNNFQIVIPTPFFKYPFEFTIGFRQFFLAILACYAVAVIAVKVDNLNLGLVVFILLALIAMSFYTKPEPYFYIWIFAENRQQFILKKIKIAIFYSFILFLPINILLSIFYFDKILLILGIQFLGTLYVVLGLLGKYAAYPSEINLPQAFSIGLCVVFPPLLLVFIPLFYLKSLKN